MTDHNDRRINDGISLQIMGQVREAFKEHEKHESETFREMKADIKQNRTESDDRHIELLERFESMESKTTNFLETTNTTVNEIHKLFKKAFPEGDVDAHRKAHEYLIEKDKEDKEFWLKLKQDVVKWAALAVISWGGLVLWAAFLKGPGA